MEDEYLRAMGATTCRVVRRLPDSLVGRCAKAAWQAGFLGSAVERFAMACAQLAAPGTTRIIYPEKTRQPDGRCQNIDGHVSRSLRRTATDDTSYRIWPHASGDVGNSVHSPRPMLLFRSSTVSLLTYVSRYHRGSAWHA